ncbi:MAG: response regulator transcription factor [Myxococcota bacterium]
MTTTLLGVDDSKTMRKVIEITFGGEDFKTVLAENADDAMSKLGAERPSIVLVDAALEGTNGYELCQRIKAAAPSVGVLLLASKQQPYDRNRGTQVGADDFVDKPFDTQQLIDKVSALARKLAGAGSHPLASTQQGLGAAAAPPPASAPRPAPAQAPAHAPAHAPQAVVSARPASLDVSARPRSPTLAYGNVNPMAPAAPGAGPVAPMIPSPAAAPRAPVASPAPPAPPAARPPAPVTAPPPVHAAPTPAPPPPAAPAPAPPAAAAAAAPIAAAAAAATNGADFASKLSSLGLTRDQITGVLALSREVVEKVVWEVVPTLAETLIKEEIKRLTSE